MANSSTPEAAPKESAPKVVRIHRFQIGVNVLIQILVIIAIVLMINYMSFRHFKRWDFSREHKYALSSQTKNLLKSLKKPVKAIVFFSSGSEITPDVSSLLREYEYASDNRFKTEVVDPYRNLTRAQDLQQKYKFGANENIVILDYDNRSKFVNVTDMADYDMPDQMSMMMGQQQPKLKDFKGEQAITSALLELSEGKPNKVYFLAGHGEPELKSQDLTVFNEALKRQNIQVAPLNLLNVSSIPADARALVICGPKYDYSELEVKLLNDFWEKHGRLFVLLNPFARTERLSGWLGAQGVVPQDDRILRVGKALKLDDQGSPQITNAVIGNPAFDVLDSHTKITKDLEDVSKQMLGATQSLQIDQSREVIAKVHVTPVLKAGEGFWGETELTGNDQNVSFDPAKDHKAPLYIAVAAEKGGVEDQRVKVDTSRMFVVGNAEMLSAGAYRMSEGVSIDLTVNVLNWLLDREELMGIPPKEKKSVTLSFDEKQLRSLAIAVVGIIPCIAAFFGFINWWMRRS